MLHDLVMTLMLVADTLRSRKMNWRFDSAIKPFKIKQLLADERQQNQDLNLSQRSKEEEKKAAPSGDTSANVAGQPTVGADDQQQVVDLAEQQRQLSEQRWLEEEQMSSSLSIVKMTLNNIHVILSKVLESKTATANKFNFELSE